METKIYFIIAAFIFSAIYGYTMYSIIKLLGEKEKDDK